MLDTYRPVETPEGVEIGLRMAGPVPRLFAAAIDAVIRSGIYFVLVFPASLLGQGGVGLLLLIMFLMEWFYPVWFEVRKGGATPGKRRMGLLVLHRDGTPVGWMASIVRNLVRFADFLPMAYGFGIASMLIDRDFRRLGDLAAGTVVVHREPEMAGYRVPTGPPVRPAVPLGLDEQRAVLDFAERIGTWSEARSAELALLAAPLTGIEGRDAGVEGVKSLLGIANWLLGRR
ncbi:MAG TPA: RDD family protein [Thermoanaerobaculia bacterium]|nr:RDD family protein [Thermoanaerobaculia bacterium]